MGLAPKFKQWVDDIKTINGIYTSLIENKILVYITNDHVANVEWTARETLKSSESGVVDLVITNIKTNKLVIREPDDKSTRVPLDDKHLEYLNAKLKRIISLRTVNYWEDLYRRISKAIKDMRTKEAIDRFF